MRKVWRPLWSVGGWEGPLRSAAQQDRNPIQAHLSVCAKKKGRKRDGGGRKKSPFDPPPLLQRPSPPPPPISMKQRRRGGRKSATYHRTREGGGGGGGEGILIFRGERGLIPLPLPPPREMREEGGRKGGFLSTPLLPLPCWKTEEDFRGEGKGKISSSSSSVAAFLPSYRAHEAEGGGSFLFPPSGGGEARFALTPREKVGCQ